MLKLIFKKQLIQPFNWSVHKPTPKKMSVFTKKINVLTGASEWVLQDENYDFHQEIARSAFADMLHDSERNDKYYAGIKSVIDQTHRAGKKAHVLDIGTGTGLLAMMAARCGADTIYACEAFSPISSCAEQVIQENGLADRITVVHKRSTEMTAGVGGDMPHRANILVTEVFDTELIGEGAISTFNHAHKNLLERDSLVVPTSGTVYAQVIESSWLQRHNKLSSWTSLQSSRGIDKCPGAAAVHDLQISQINTTNFRAITTAVPVFSFDWTCRSQIPEDDHSVVKTKVVKTGTADAVFMWWSLVMDPQGEVVLSCAPWWKHPQKPQGPDDIPWRDHWMQAVYYLPTSIPFVKDQELTLLSSHDEYSLWFNVTTDNSSEPKQLARPVCECMLHVTCSRSRLGMLNDPSRRAKYLSVIKRLVTPETVVLSWGDSSLLGLLAATLGAQKVYHIEENVISREVVEELVKDNNLKSKVSIRNSTKIDEKIRSSVNLVIGEPYFLNTLYPWDVLRWWFLRQQCPTAPCMPVAATLHAVPMQFDHLQKIRALLGTINGFKMTAFDKLIQKASELSDSNVEAQPLWEYPGVCLATSTQVQTYDLTGPLPGAEEVSEGTIPFKIDGTCHGVALWLDVHLDLDTIVSTGPQVDVTPGKRVEWDPYSRQGVYFMLPQETVTPQTLLRYKVNFSPISGEITFRFSIDK